MKIVYHCFGGAHASPTAAAIHLGLLPQDRIPRLKEFREIPYFDSATCISHGNLTKVGWDRLGNEVYILGRRNSPDFVIKVIKEFLRLRGDNPEDYLFVSCVQLLNPFMVTGGFSSRAMGWVGFGRPLVTFGTILSYPALVKIVRKTWQVLERERLG